MVSIEARPGNFSSHHLAKLGVVAPGDWSRQAGAQLDRVLPAMALNGEAEGRVERYLKLEKAVDNHLSVRLRTAVQQLRVATEGEINIRVEEPIGYKFYVVPHEKRPVVTAVEDRFGVIHGDECDGFFLNEYKLAVVYSRGDLLRDAYVLAHEKEHSLGRLWIVTSYRYQKMSMWRTGHMYAIKYALRGRLLEEGDAVAAGISFLASDQFADAFPSEVAKMLAQSGDGEKDGGVKGAAEKMMEKRYGAEGEYWLFYKARQKMIEGARLVEPQFENLLTLSRVHPPLERLVRNACDKTFGRGTYRRILRTNQAKGEFGKLALNKLLDWLELPTCCGGQSN